MLSNFRIVNKFLLLCFTRQIASLERSLQSRRFFTLVRTSDERNWVTHHPDHCPLSSLCSLVKFNLVFSSEWVMMGMGDGDQQPSKIY